MTKEAVFLTDGTWGETIAAVRAFGRKGIDVFVGDTVRPPFGLYSRFCKGYELYPSPENENFVCSLYELVRKTGAFVLIPISNPLTYIITKHKKMFEELVRIPSPEFETLMKAYNKLETMRLAHEQGIPVPQTYFGFSGTLSKLLDTAIYPLILKPALGGGAGRGIMYARSRAELVQAYNAITSRYGLPLVQEYIPGDVRQLRIVDLLFDRDSRLVAYFTARKIRQFPLQGGAMTCGESTHELKLVEMCEKLLKSWRWFGLADIDIKIDPRDDVPKLLEVNPRPWTHFQFPIEVGVDFPILLYKVALDRPIDEIPHYRVGVRYIHPFKDPLAIIQQFKSSTIGRLCTLARSLSDYRGDKVLAYLSKDDFRPFLGKLFALGRTLPDTLTKV